VCRIAELEVDRGVTALVHGQAIAIFRTHDDAVYALGNHDPFVRTAAPGGLAKGIVGVRGDVPFVASPVHKHGFDLRTGRCLDDVHVTVPAYDVKVVEGVVMIGHRKIDAA
jgi:nitrite reductase (NADH) small subunit